MLGDRGRDSVVGPRGQLDRQRHLDGLRAGNVRQDLHVDAGGVHRGDPLLTQIEDAGWPPVVRAAVPEAAVAHSVE